MRTYALPAVLVLYGITAYADVGGVTIWSDSASLGPSAAAEGDAYRFINVDDVALTTQETTITLTYPERVSFDTMYGFDVKKAGPPVTVAFVPDTAYNWSGYLPYRVGAFEVSVRGKKVDDALIQGPRKVGDGDDAAFVFPIDFGAAGRCDVRVAYSYVLKEEAAFVDLSRKRGDLLGLEYSLAPAQYWAGGVERVGISVVLEGADVSDLGRISPWGFKFVPNGVRWEWRYVTDELLREGYDNGGLGVAVFFGAPTDLNNDVTTVLADGGLTVRAGGGTLYDPLAVLPKGARLYVYAGGIEGGRISVYNAGSVSHWLRCRTFDNVEGYVCNDVGGEYYLDSYDANKAAFPEEGSE